MTQVRDSDGEKQLQRSVQRGELHLVYQPVVGLADGALVGVEALVRWDHPTLGLLWPEDFLHLTEESPLLAHLSRWVLHQAARQAATWQASFPAQRLTVAVNVGSSELAAADLASCLAELVHGNGLETGSLAVEIPESDLFDEPDCTRPRLDAIKNLGVRIIVDDFGHAYSSLVSTLSEMPSDVATMYREFVAFVAGQARDATLECLGWLRGLPIDVVKLDRRFVSRLLDGSNDASLVGAVVASAHALGFHTLAEGVENAAEAQQLRELGCDLAQGYNFHRPQPAEYIALLLRERQPSPAAPSSS